MQIAKRTLRDVPLAGRRAFVRVDFNVPLKNGAIGDDTRIRESLPTLRAILQGGGAAVVASHLGRPKDGTVAEDMRLGPVAQRLQELLGSAVRVSYVQDTAGPAAAAAAAQTRPGQILLLENLRFHAGETKNSPELAAALAALGQYFVQDAFGTCHRAHASTAGVPARLKPAVAGLLLEKEIAAFDMIFRDPQRPLVAIIGGAKVSDKILLLENLVDKVDEILIGGGMAYTFLKAQGLAVGKSLVEDERLEVAKAVLARAAAKGVKLHLPGDHVCADRFAADAAVRVTGPSVPEGWMGLDLGPESRRKYAAAVAGAGTVVWNGPMGVFEMEPFRAGTAEIARALAQCRGRSIVGGGDSVAALHLVGAAASVTHASTGGGAFLEMLEGKELPGIAALDDAGTE